MEVEQRGKGSEARKMSYDKKVELKKKMNLDGVPHVVNKSQQFDNVISGHFG